MNGPTDLESSGAPAPLFGLILAGGQSSRMEQDKSSLHYHGMSQRDYCFELLSGITEGVYLSCRPDQLLAFADFKGHLLADRIQGLGPAGGILTAQKHSPHAAWLVVACDLPYLLESDLKALIAERDLNKCATALASSDNGLPEPLAAIWEPKSHSVILDFVSRNITCPRKILINTQTKCVAPLHSVAVANVNTPAEASLARQTLESQKPNVAPRACKETNA